MNISQYIRQNEELNVLDFLTVYATIVELLKDKRMTWNFEEEVKENV